MTDIQIVRTDGSNPIIIAEGEDVDQAKLDGSVPHQLLISLPTHAVVDRIHTQIPGLQIVWHLTP